MNEQLKKRLVGAVVLVALAVIFLPMLLEGDKRSGIPLFGSNVPEPPPQRIGALDIPLQVPPPPAPAAVVVERELPPPAEPEAEPEAAPTPAATPPASAPAPAVPPAPVPASKPDAPLQPVQSAELPPKPSATASWAVQVGSFAEPANASRLRDSLRTKGYPAYVEQVKLSSGTAYRVRVGPVLSRADAEAIQTKLAKIDQRGIVVPHP